MKNYPQYLKSKLKSIIKDMSKSTEKFVKNPLKDFTRDRKITFEDLITFLLSSNGGTLNKELLDYFHFNEKIVSASALVQQRLKLKEGTLEYLFENFTKELENLKTFNKYRLVAIDGSKLNIPHNPEDYETYIKSTKKSDHKGYNSLNINTVFDLMNKIYLAANIQTPRKFDERQSAIDMLERLDFPSQTIVIADRGYESYNFFANLQNKELKYVIRIRDNSKNGIVTSLNMNYDNEFDEEVTRILTRKQTKEIKNNPQIYKFLPLNSKFEYLDSSHPYFKFSFRVVRFKISEDTYETLITNTDKTEFSAENLKEIYHMRWGIETSFRELKYAIGLVNLHSKKVDFIIQEIFAKLTMYNFCEKIALNVVISQKERKYDYQVNFTMAIYICKNFFKAILNKNTVEPLIQRYILPVRKNRQAKRLIRIKSSISFLYRLA